LFFSKTQYDKMEFDFGVDLRIVLKSQELGDQHVQPSTGLLLWPAATVLSEFISANRSLFATQTVLELGSGVV